jgi:dTDP-4-amino-4,6-dideoxygalactose transaminase
METISFLPVLHLTDRQKPEIFYTPQTIIDFLENFFHRGSAILTVNGRQALSYILQGLNLRRTDEVCIFTTFDFPNVSSCVTSTVFNFCKPSRVFSESTKAVIVIHEFGVPYKDINTLVKECKKRDIPLIEDCAHTIDSTQSGVKVGSAGDWIIGSFPKIFPVYYGGFLIGKTSGHIHSSYRQAAEIENLASNLGSFLDQLDDFSSARRKVFHHLTDHAVSLGLQPVYVATEEITPWFFPLPVADVEKVFEQAERNKIECALWHGTNIVVFPCHQFISMEHINRIADVIRSTLD